MSGIVGIVNTDGAPVDRGLLVRLTASLDYRGPDARAVWIDGHVGFGHTMLRTTDESVNERQPLCLDGSVWITADARVDGRAELRDKLGNESVAGLDTVTDVELILHAYRRWDTACVDHLLGDFAFAIWDGRKQRLFCARDHFGVKPFFYARVGTALLFGNTLNCLRLHPGVSDTLNEVAIGDFLLFGTNQDPATTTFSDLRRLPGAHCLTWSRDRVDVSRYWSLPIDGHIRYKRSRDYVDHF
jgi:asparagine synthase (glutamine-hydrolysing)